MKLNIGKTFSHQVAANDSLAHFTPISGIGDRRNQNQGAKPLIEDVEQARLWQVLQENAPDGGLWNGRKVADWLS